MKRIIIHQAAKVVIMVAFYKLFEYLAAKDKASTAAYLARQVP